MNKEQFQLEHQWNLYLERVGLKGKSLPVNQYREMKQTFFGACGQILLLLRDDVAALDDDEAMKVMESFINQVGEFFIAVSNRQN